VPKGSAEPGFIAWLIAFVSLVLPWVGGALAVAGAYRLSVDPREGAALVACGLALFVLDVAIDWWWAHPSVSRTSEPRLNDRGGQLIGRELIVAEAIVHGRGKVRAGDTLWPCAGSDCPAGTRVRVKGSKGTVLAVEVDPRSGHHQPFCT
jgi:membrane protein implicated in regulation of membrane protease activity